MRRAFTINGCPIRSPRSPLPCPRTRRRPCGTWVTGSSLPPWGTGNAVEAIGIAPAAPAQAKALGFPRPGMLYGVADSRAPAGSAVGVDDNQEVR